MQRSKAEVRAAILRARRRVSKQVHSVEAQALADHLSAFIADTATVCAYVPVGSEPGSIELLDSLHSRGVHVLLPVARADIAGLQWGDYRPGALVEAPFGLREPAPPWSGGDAISDASVILVPALAVDRSGVRLGRGAGFYDRALPLADPAARLIAVVRDDELVDVLPVEPHDVRMTHALTPERGLVTLG
ncbi:5-formyltetrahydrofolate cyclo-ligase [Mycobacterium sp. NPDC051804]|uniref:5-formyltetrahydrofolate cyclo-ligase n=1 Tax=Mycobacterium sp. NPDC051804 TaxID=3364295 RepID=UPI0037B52D08